MIYIRMLRKLPLKVELFLKPNWTWEYYIPLSVNHGPKHFTQAENVAFFINLDDASNTVFRGAIRPSANCSVRRRQAFILGQICASEIAQREDFSIPLAAVKQVFRLYITMMYKIAPRSQLSQSVNYGK